LIMDFGTLSTPDKTVFRSAGFFIIEHDRRKILHFNVTEHPTGPWIVQQLREAFPESRYAILDGDAKFGQEVTDVLKADGIKSVRISPASPWQKHLRRRQSERGVRCLHDLRPAASFPGPTDGNLYHRFGAATAPAFRSLGYTFKCVDFRAAAFANLVVLRNSTLFQQSRTQYAPGYEANSLLTDPRFRQISADGGFHPLDDLRLRADSPARSVGIALPPDLQALDDDVGSSDGAVAAPIPAPRDIGCYRFGSKPLNVGVQGRRHFPIIGTIP
jgi:hypothetical protein